MKRNLLLILIAVCLFPLSIQAQLGPPQVAYLNSSGQLVVAGADGITRWIVTNPGEVLNPTLGYQWSPDRMRLFFAVDIGTGTSLRVAEVAVQAVTEMGQVSGSLSGGSWVSNSALQIAANGTLYQANVTGGLNPLLESDQNISLISPFSNDRPHLPAPSSTGGGFSFIWQNGRYAILGNSAQPLPDINNDIGARNSGLWSPDEALVAYWGFGADGSSRLAVTRPDTLETLVLASNSSTPTIPLAWNRSTELIFRDASGTIRIADVRCLAGGCADNPLEAGIAVAPASASDFQVINDWAIYRENEQIRAVPLRCFASNDCAEQIAIIGTNAAPRTILHTSSNRLIYTAYIQDALNPTDRNAMVIDDLGCLPNCQPRLLVNHAISGMLSLNGNVAVVDMLNEGMHIINISDGTRIFLAQVGEAGSGLLRARW